MNMIYKNFYILLFLILAFGYFYSPKKIYAGSAPSDGGTSTQCDDQAFYDSLGQSESGGCPDQYTCMGPVINNGGMHDGTRPHGKYQFMPATLKEFGITDLQGFINNPALQEATIREFTARNDACLERNGAYEHIGQVRNGVTITRSGLLGAAHLGGCGGASRWAKGGGGGSDQLGTSLADYAARFGGYGVFGDVPGGTCGGGLPNAADLFAQAQVKGLHNLIGCDENLMKQGSKLTTALTQQQIEASNAMITQPTPVEQLSCFDQTTEIFSELGGIHSNPQEDIGFSINPNVQLPLKNFLDQFLNNNIMGGVNDFINQAFNNVTQKFASLFGSGGGGLFTAGPASNCDMQQQAWLISQCIEMPTIPSLGDILGGQIGELMGTINDLANPQRLIEQVCSAANKQIQGLFNEHNAAFEDAAAITFERITDRVGGGSK